MLTNPAMTEAAPPPQAETIAEGPVIVAPGVDGAIVQTPAAQPAESTENGPGVDGEETVWEGHYSWRNFIGRMIFGGLLVAAWILLLVDSWHAASAGRENAWSFWLYVGSIVVLFYWMNLGYRFLRAHRGHHYRLTNRRLFVTTGFFSRRVDQIELLRLKDVYIQQSMIGDWLGIGNLVLISSEQTLPKAYLLGIDQPREVMDLVWHHMRAEQTQKTSRINPV